MGLNLSLAGKQYPGSTFDVSVESIEKYARATNETNPAYFGPSSIAPVAFAVVPVSPALGAVLFDEELGANVARLVHGEQRHTFQRPISGGDQLRIATVLESIEEKQSGHTFTIVNRLTDAAGEMVAQVMSLMFVRGSGRGGGGAVGQEDPAPEWEISETVDKDQTFRYAEASGDNNPIHVDETFATQSAGLPGIILHGMCTFAFAARAVVDRAAGGDPSRVAEIKARFSRPVFPGEVLTTRGWSVSNESVGFVMTNKRGANVLSVGSARLVP